MDAKKFSVLIADDHEVVGLAYRLLLEKAGAEVVGVVSTGRQAVDAALRLEPDIILLDIAMPDMDGFAALSAIKYLRPESRLFVITCHSEKAFMTRALELGASAFLSKAVSPERLIESIQAAMAGEPVRQPAFFSPGPAAPTMPGLSTMAERPRPKDDLTDQEKLILTLLSMGYNSQDIRDQLVVSSNTLKSHLNHIYRKIGVTDRTQAAIWAIRNGYGPYGADAQTQSE